jgi:osmotically-inducible protein OsmY
MLNDYNYDYSRSRYDQGDYDEPYYRDYGGYEEPYCRGYDGQLASHVYGRGRYYGEPYLGRRPGGYYGEPYGAYDYGRARAPYYRRGHEGGHREPYHRWYGRGAEERGVFDRAGDEVRPWFGDEEAERRRRLDDMHRGVYAGRGPRGYRRSDERISEDINDRLTDDWRVDASDVEVTVNNGMITLAGRVGSREEKRRAEDIAESVSGVTDVSNQLRVGRSATIETDAVTAGGTRARTAKT